LKGKLGLRHDGDLGVLMTNLPRRLWKRRVWDTSAASPGKRGMARDP
jgi:hypothetical protein